MPPPETMASAPVVSRRAGALTAGIVGVDAAVRWHRARTICEYATKTPADGAAGQQYSSRVAGRDSGFPVEQDDIQPFHD